MEISHARVESVESRISSEKEKRKELEKEREKIKDRKGRRRRRRRNGYRIPKESDRDIRFLVFRRWSFGFISKVELQFHLSLSVSLGVPLFLHDRLE